MTIYAAFSLTRVFLYHSSQNSVVYLIHYEENVFIVTSAFLLCY